MFGCVQWCSLKGAPAARVDNEHAVVSDNVEELSIPSPFEVRGEVSSRKGRSTAFTVAPRTLFMYGSPAGSPFVAAESFTGHNRYQRSALFLVSYRGEELNVKVAPTG